MDFYTMYAQEISQGYKGTLSFIFEAIVTFEEEDAQEKVFSGFNRMYMNNITGSKLYMLWNDCLCRDTKRAVFVMLHDTIDSILWHINFENGRGIPYTENEPKPYIKEDGEWWIFTFLNDGSEKAGKCVKVQGTFAEARTKMIEQYGRHWRFQYSETEWEKQWNDPDRRIEMEDVIESIR